MSLNIQICKKCNKSHDFSNCPYCNLKQIKISQERENEKRKTK